ncbi:MAG TPA: hypothetical protein VMH33_08935 [Solirubrobacterales bacterium]|nr:hypothetical protein [Solirubrobacterales bacterium]
MEAVFDPELEAAGGIYKELEPEEFLSRYAAVVPAGSLPQVQGESARGLAAEHPDMPVLLESTAPLEADNPAGEEEAVDLGLEKSEGELQPQNPISEVGIPDELGEGISLPGSEVEVTLKGAPDNRVATDAEGEFAFYPEVAEDTDLVVAPISEGVETMQDVRTDEAPTRATYELSLPPAAELVATADGGAEVVEGGRATLVIPPPTATDAAGDPVEAHLAVVGDDITVSASPTPSTVYPILVDPTFVEAWNWTWEHSSTLGWHKSASSEALWPYEREQWAAEPLWGLDIASGIAGTNATPGTWANWEYWVPRYSQEIANYGTEKPPTTWISELRVEGFQFHEFGNRAYYPAAVWGLIDPRVGWQSDDIYYGNQGDKTSWSESYPVPNYNSQHWDKGAELNLVTYENEMPAKARDTFYPKASVTLVDEEAPVVKRLTEPPHWVNTTVEPIEFLFEDEGLGVKGARIRLKGANSLLEKGVHSLFGAEVLSIPCTGAAASPCPRVASSNPREPANEAKATLAYNPAELPSGIDQLEIGVFDPVGNMKWEPLELEVDHTAPELTLSGPITEQGEAGTRRSSYPLRITAKDGTEAAPQSGVRSLEVEVDGKKVAMPEEAEWNPDCQTQNCHVSDEWVMNAAEYAAGAHEVKVIVEDAVGNVTTKILHVELHPPAPTLTLSGTMTEQATKGSERPTYTLKVKGTAAAESPTPAGTPTYSLSFGSTGSGNGQLTRPGGMAIDPEGDIWVVDTTDNRLEQFNGAGGYLSQVRPEASSKCALSRPTAVAIDAAGDLWVTDSGHKRVVELSQSGACLREVGGPGTTEGKFAGSGPEAIAIDYHGDVWVADTYGGRLEKFGEEGNFIRSVATKGKGNGQLGEPDGIAIAPGGHIYVSDWEDDKVAEYDEGGNLIRQFGTIGKEAGELEDPTGIAVDPQGDVWVADEKNERVEEFTQAGEYVGSFGGPGSGAGQFELSYPTGIATDARGDIWVGDPDANRVEKWVSSHFYNATTAPTFIRSIGTYGTTPGHLNAPSGVAVDAQGRLWVADYFNDTLQRYNSKGEFETLVAGEGHGPGQLIGPQRPVISGGHVWIADTGNNRIEEFEESGKYVGSFGEGGEAAGKFDLPGGSAIDPNHRVWVADTLNSRVQELTESGTWIRTIGISGTGKLEYPVAVAVGPGNTIYVVDNGDNRIVEFSETGEFIRQFGNSAAEPAGQLANPRDIYVDPDGHVWVVERGHDLVKEYTTEGAYLGQFGSEGSGPGQLSQPASISGDGAGHIFVADMANHRIEEWGQDYVSTLDPTYTRSIGTYGTGAGQQNGPAGVAVDPSGRLWVTDWLNDTLLRYNSQGEYEATFGGQGKEAGKLERPLGLAISGGTLWVADSANDRVEKFSEAGGYVGQFGSAGTGNAQFNNPGPPAIDPNHHVWVPDSGNNRVQELSESGEWIRTIGTEGSGKLKEPFDVAVGPGDTIFVADYGDNRVVEFNGETGEYIRQIGKVSVESAARLTKPIGVYVDGEEHLWVSERGANRVKEYTTAGVYLGEFGSEGSGPGQLSTVTYITGDGAGHLFAADLNNHRVEEWSEPATHSQISTEVSVEGVRKSGFATSCATKTCSVSGEWPLTSSSLGPGTHEVKVTATDGLGDTTTKMLDINIARDTTKPSIALTGTLATAPEGWIQQEDGNYTFTAEATDAGYGVTSLVFSIDGKTMTSKTQTCAGGACSAKVTKTVNAHTLTAGAHAAEVVATDGAGNVATKKWTVNVDPEGHISAAAAEATLEAVEETTSTDLVGDPTDSSEIPGMEAGLGLEEENGELHSTGSNVPMTIGEGVEEGEEMSVASEYALATPCEGAEAESGPTEESGAPVEKEETIIEPEIGSADEEIPCVSLSKLYEMAEEEEKEVATGLKKPGVTPITIVPPGVAPVSEVEGNAAIAPNTEPEADTVTRPIMDGGFNWDIIRGPSAPEHYAYEMELGPRQELRLINEQEAAVFYTRTGNRGFTILATPAHDAIGSTVPTHLSVKGEILTLTIEYRGMSAATGEPFVYPITSGTGWEGGWQSHSELIPGEPEEPSPGELVGEGWYARELPTGGWIVGESGAPVVGAPTYEQSVTSSGVATASSAGQGQVRAFEVATVPWCERFYEEGNVPNPLTPQTSDPNKECPLTAPSIVVRGFITVLFHYETNPHHAVWWDFGRYEDNYCEVNYRAYAWEGWNKSCQFSGPNQQSGSGAHIVAKDFWRTIGRPTELAIVGRSTGECWPDYIVMEWNGTVSKNLVENHGLAQLAPEGATCNWAELEQ